MKKSAQSVLELGTTSEKIKELKSLLVSAGEKQAQPGAYFTNLNPDKQTSLPMIEIYDVDPKEANDPDYKELVNLAWQEAKQEVYSAINSEMEKSGTRYINELEAAKNPGHWLYLVDSFTGRLARKKEQDDSREEASRKKTEKEQKQKIIDLVRPFRKFRSLASAIASNQLIKLDLQTLQDLLVLVRNSNTTNEQVEELLIPAFKMVLSKAATINYKARLRVFAEKLNKRNK